MKENKIVIAQALNGMVRIRAIVATELVEKARLQHQLLATSAAALGRTLIVTALMASDLKDNKARITTIFNGKGQAGTVLAQADGAGHVRGFIANPSLYLVRDDGHLDVAKAIGCDGELKVIKDLGLKEPFIGRVKIQTGEVGDDFAYYFAMSEQIPSIVGVGVLVKQSGNIGAAGGIILQTLPGAKEEVINKLEEIAKEMKPVTEMISSGLNAEEMIKAYLPDVQILALKKVELKCSCSKEYYLKALTALSKKDLDEMIEKDHGAEVTCQFCNQKYQFNEDDLKEVLSEKKMANS